MLRKTIEQRLADRIEFVGKWGGKCVRCGETDPRLLVVRWRNSSARLTYKQAIAEPEKFVVVCGNCYWLGWWERAFAKAKVSGPAHVGTGIRQEQGEKRDQLLLALLTSGPRPLQEVVSALVTGCGVSAKTAYGVIDSAVRDGWLSKERAEGAAGGHNEKMVRFS